MWGCVFFCFCTKIRLGKRIKLLLLPAKNIYQPTSSSKGNFKCINKFRYIFADFVFQIGIYKTNSLKMINLTCQEGHKGEKTAKRNSVQ